MISLHFYTILEQNKDEYSMASLNCYIKWYINIVFMYIIYIFFK